TPADPPAPGSATSAALDAAEAEARRLGARMVVAIVDGAGALQGYRRMDGAPLASMTLATDKAYTAAATGTDTASLGARLYADAPLLHGFRAMPRVLAFQGGHPIVLDGAHAGGVAVGGGRAEHDAAVAQAAIAAMQPASPN